MKEAAYNEAGEPIDEGLPKAPIQPGNTLAEMTVLHIYRRDPFKPESEWGLIGFYCHPNPLAVDEKERGICSELPNWHVDRVRYVRAEHRVCEREKPEIGVPTWELLKT